MTESDWRRKEILAQAEVFSELDPLHNGRIDLEIANNFAQAFRMMIIDFEEVHGRVPTKDEIIWCVSVNLGHNIREDVAKWLDQLEQGESSEG